MTKDLKKKEESAITTPLGFGGVEDVPMGSVPPKIRIDRERAKYEVGGEALVETLAGHILYMRRYNRFYGVKYDPSNKVPPQCSSSNAIAPDGGEAMMGNSCAECPHNQFRDHDDGGRGKDCQNRMLVFFIKDGDAIPSTIDLPATSLNPNQADGILQFSSVAINKCSEAGLGGFFQPAKVRLGLESKTFSSGSSSIMTCMVTGVETDPVALDKLVQFYARIDSEQATAAVEDTIAEGDDIPI